MTTELVNSDDSKNDAKVIESLVLRGDISGLGPRDRALYYTRMCNSLGLNTMSHPFAFLRLNGKEVMYATKGATDQLAAIHKLNREIIDGPKVIDLAGTKLVYAVARVTHPNGRTETATATVPLVDPVNVLMKCETKAKRRATLSILGFGMLDETELETIPDAVKEPGGGIDLATLSPSTLPTPRVSLDGLGIETPAATPAETHPRDSMVQTILARIAEIELPGESVAVWMKYRSDLVAMPMVDREGVWRALCDRTAAVGKMKDARVWLKKAIAVEDERRKADANEEARIIVERSAVLAGLFESMTDAIANAQSLDALAKVVAKVEKRINELGPSEAATIRTMLADRRAVLSQQPPPDGTTGGRRAKSGTHPIADGAGDGAASEGSDGPTAWLRDAATCRAHVATTTHIAALMASARKHAGAIAARPYAVRAYAERAACLDPMLSADQGAETFSSPGRNAA